MRFLLDTNILIEELLGNAPLAKLPGAETPAISTITVMEILALPGLSAVEEEQVRTLLARCLILSVDFAVASRAAQLQRTRKKGSGFDLLIAATAIVYDCEFVTKNIRDFRGIPDLRIWKGV